MEVIKPRDQVFLGHKIPRCEVSANLREKIVERALKCTEKPSIIFDYHYRQAGIQMVLGGCKFANFQDKL